MAKVQEQNGLSIGALSRAVGVPVETLRTWERRYGYPLPIRRPSGHRRFPLETVERLVLVRELMGQGHRAAAVVGATLKDLEMLRSAAEPEKPRRKAPQAVFPRLDDWLDATRRMDGMELDRLLAEGWNSQGCLTFMQDVLAPYLAEIGELWSRGEIGIGHEHYVSNRVTQFLMGQWQNLDRVSKGPTAVLATLPGEPHVIGLHMAATTLALRGWSLRFLGADTPVKDIAMSTIGASAVVIGVSRSAYPDTVTRHLYDLRTALPSHVPIWVGGAPFPIPSSLIGRQFHNLQELWDTGGEPG